MQLFLNMPLRMRIGLFAIWLAKVARVLQVRYANWNDEFRLLHEDCADGLRYFHVSSEVTSNYLLSFHGRNAQQEKQSPMVRELFDVQGVRQVSLEPYCIRVGKGEVFTWEELSPRIEAIILRHQTA